MYGREDLKYMSRNEFQWVQISFMQGSRIEDQRTELPRVMPVEAAPEPKPAPKEEARAKTIPDDDFFAQLMKAQAGRMEDQRASVNNRVDCMAHIIVY